MREVLAIIAALTLLAGCRSHGATEDLAARLDNWRVEKWDDNAVSVDVRERSLSVTTHSEEHGVMVWLRRELPPDFVFEYDFRPLSDSGFFLIFFCAKGNNGND